MRLALFNKTCQSIVSQSGKAYLWWQVHTRLARLDAFFFGHTSIMTPTLIPPMPSLCEESAPPVEMTMHSHHSTSKLLPILIIYTSRICSTEKLFSIQTRSCSMAVLPPKIWWRNMLAIMLHSLETLPRAWSKWANSSHSQGRKGRSESIAEKWINYQTLFHMYSY